MSFLISETSIPTGAHVEFGELFNYVWEVPETAGPTDEQTSSIVWL